MATPTLREDALQGLSAGLDVLAAFADSLPSPAPAIFALAQHVIVTAEAVEGNREECSALDDHTRQLVTVVFAAMKAKAENLKEHYVPAHLEQNVERFHETLKKIDKTITKIHKILHSDRKRDKLRAFISAKWYTGELKKCSDDLNWAMELFMVTEQLQSSLRICHVSQQIEGVADQVGEVGTEVRAVGAKVEVATTAVTSVAEEVTHVTNVVEDTSTKVSTVFTNSLLESLPRSKRASSICARPDRPGGCFEGTRVETIKTIREWMIDPDPNIPKCFWMSGIAGVGKTTVAYSIVELARSLGILGADFFFSRLGEDELRDPALVFPTLAYQLALSDPEFARVITAALERDPKAGFSSLKIQLDTLIIDPLSTLKRDPKRLVVLVLDAFDECEAKGAKEILQLLVDSLSRLPFFLKIVITSRPEKHIQSVLLPSSKLSVTRLHDIEEHIVADDIKRYLTARLRELPKKPGYEGLSEDWITDAEIQILVAAAGALFVHAATSLRFLTGDDGLPPRELLNILLAIIKSPRNPESLSTNPYVDLDTLYQQILIILVSRPTGAVLSERFRRVVGTIVLLRDPLPVAALSCLIQLDAVAVTALLSTLQSVVLLPSSSTDSPRVYHPSFPDFLQDPNRCSDSRLWIDSPIHEARIALRCLEIMNTLLHKNMLGKFDTPVLNSEIPDLTGRINTALSLELQYACRHWAAHLASVFGPADERIPRELDVFASRALLPWLETLSWLGQTRLAIRSLEAVNAWVASSSSCSPITVSLLKDGYRLLLAHFPTITESALHIARSVLPLAPQQIQLSATYADYADPHAKVIQGADLGWSACLMSLTDRKRPIYCVAIKIDGTRIASGSSDNTVRVWDANSGDLVAVLEGHTGFVNAVAFSPDGDRIVSGSSDKTVRLWDVLIGREVSKLEGHGGPITSVSYSPDGTHIASGSLDDTIVIWDAVTGGVLLRLEGHSSGVYSVTFFPDGRRLASGSSDQTVRVWDLEDRTCVTKLDHFKTARTVAISPDGLQIVSGSDGNTLRIWDASSGICVGTLQGHTGSVNAVDFSPNGSRIVSASNDKSVRMWDASTHEIIATYNGHGAEVTSLAVSHDGLHIVSGSIDQSIKVWDASAMQGEPEADQAHPEGIVSLAFSKSCLAVLTWGPSPTQLAVHTRDLANSWGPDIISFPFRQWGDFNWGFRVRFAASDTRIVVTSDTGSFLYDASTGNEAQDEKIPESEHASEPPFSFEEGKVLRHTPSSSDLVCILSPSLQANDIAPFEVDGEPGHRILVGCRDGRFLTLHVT